MDRPRRRAPSLLPLVIALATSISAPHAAPQTSNSYHVYVASAAADTIALIEFDGVRATKRAEFETGVMAVDIDGPHGLALSPDGEFVYVSLAHGQPYGTVPSTRRRRGSSPAGPRSGRIQP